MSDSIPPPRGAIAVPDAAVAEALRAEISAAWVAMHNCRRRGAEEARTASTPNAAWFFENRATAHLETLLTLLDVWHVAARNARQRAVVGPA